MTAAIRITGLSKTYGARRVLDSVNLEVMPGEMVALIGASGSGKSTLLRHISGLVCGDRGQVLVHGALVQEGGRLARNVDQVRAGIGFVFQQFNLVGRLSVIVNVVTGLLHRIPLWRSLLGRFTGDELRAGMDALVRVGIAEQASQRASTLSGGQQQRAAIARTLVQGARVILADEPIASLDPESSRRVMEILAAINREDRNTVLVSLHQVNVALRYCPRTVALRHGQVVYDGPSARLTPGLLRKLYGAEADEILSLPDSISTLGEKDDARRLAVEAPFGADPGARLAARAS
jgi:phosphonate transport system ATP-binding protein